jgi:hypothetical protein
MFYGIKIRDVVYNAQNCSVLKSNVFFFVEETGFKDCRGCDKVSWSSDAFRVQK